MRRFLAVIGRTYSKWVSDSAPRLGAALAFYAVFSLAPLLVICISLASFVFGRDAVNGRVFGQIVSTVGVEAAAFLQELLRTTALSGKSLTASLWGALALGLGALGFFAQLQDALNIVWRVSPSQRSSLFGSIRRFWHPLTVILGSGFILLVSLALGTAVTMVSAFAPETFRFTGMLTTVAEFMVSFIVTTGLFALILQYLPNVFVSWKQVWRGAVFTAALFTLGKFLLALYLTHVATTSTFGAAGALVTILLWAYYSAQILLFGAEFTWVLAQVEGAPLVPSADFSPSLERPISNPTVTELRV